MKTSKLLAYLCMWFTLNATLEWWIFRTEVFVPFATFTLFGFIISRILS